MEILAEKYMIYILIVLSNKKMGFCEMREVLSSLIFMEDQKKISNNTLTNKLSKLEKFSLLHKRDLPVNGGRGIQTVEYSLNTIGLKALQYLFLKGKFS